MSGVGVTCAELHDGDLIGRYLADDLDEATRDRLEAHYFDCASCFDALQVARAVREEFRPAIRWDVVSRFAVAAGLLLATGALSLWIVMLRRENHGLEERLARASAAQAQLDRQTGQIAALRDQVASLAQPQLNTPIVDLEPHGTVRGRDAVVRSVEVLPDVHDITFVLTADETAGAPPYSVMLVDGDGRTVWRASGLRKSRFDTFTLTVPAQMLRDGPASFRLSGTRSDGTPFHRYEFRIVRK